MAKKKAKKKRRPPVESSTGGGSATAEADPDAGEGVGHEQSDGAMVDAGNGGGGEPPATGADRGDGQGPRRPSPPRGRGFFEVYKRGQGYYTRMGTAIGAGILILAGANYVHEQLGSVLPADEVWALYTQNGVALGVILGFGLLTYWLVGANRRSCDFMIATEGEMKKVNWSSRATVIGSTKIVVVFVLLMGLLLFVVDTVFMFFFNSIGVLTAAPSILNTLFGSD